MPMENATKSCKYLNQIYKPGKAHSTCFKKVQVGRFDTLEIARVLAKLIAFINEIQYT